MENWRRNNVVVADLRLLGLSPSVSRAAKLTEKELTTAYRKKALELHPDKRPKDDVKVYENFHRLSESYERLKCFLARMHGGVVGEKRQGDHDDHDDVEEEGKKDSKMPRREETEEQWRARVEREAQEEKEAEQRAAREMLERIRRKLRKEPWQWKTGRGRARARATPTAACS